MKKLSHAGQVVATGAMLAENLGVNEIALTQNFNNNRGRYQEGIHYFQLKGQALQEFGLYIENFDVQISPKARSLYLWTEKGAFNHVKSLGTDEAWDAYQNLVDTYFRVREFADSLPKEITKLDALKMAIESEEGRIKEQGLRKALEAENQKLLLKSAFVDKILDAEEKIDIGQAAKILELPFGRNTLFQKLREKGVFFKAKNEPKQIYIEKGYFQLKEKWIERNNHDSFIVIKVLVTQKGLSFIASLFNSVPEPKELSTFC